MISKKVLLTSSTLALTLLISLSGLKSFAEPVFATCVTEFPTTSFIVETNNRKVEARILMHGGSNFVPFWDSLMVPNDLGVLREKAAEIKKLDSELLVTWNEDQCTWEDDNFFCSGKSDPIKSGSQIVDPWALYSMQLYEKSFAGKYEYIRLYFSFVMNGNSYGIPMKFAKDECFVGKVPQIKSLLKVKL